MQTKTIIYDFSNLSTQGSAEELKALLERELDGVDVSILVNNVGTARNAPLENQSFSDLTHQINININAQTFMSMFVLPKLLSRSDGKNKSAMINVSCISAV